MATFTEYKDGIEIEHGGFTLKLQVCEDDDNTPPDENDDGFWPSLDKDAPGYIGENPSESFESQMTRAIQRTQAWEKGEIYHIGIKAVAYKAGVRLGDDSLWGIESDNSEDYFLQVANELIDGALSEARQTLQSLTA